MRIPFLAIALAAACGAGCATKGAQFVAVPEMPSAPTPEFMAHFSPTLPSSAFKTDGWAFRQYVARYDIPEPAVSKPLDGQVLRTGFCEPAAPCRFRMSVLTLQEGLRAAESSGALRYVLVQPDGRRTEGYAQWLRPQQFYAYYRFKGDRWVLLREDDALAEHDFVQKTRDLMDTMPWP